MSNRHSYLGVDLGSISIKIVELVKEKGFPKLLNYGYSEKSIEVTKKIEDGQEKEIADIIQEIHRKAHMKSREAVAALPSFSVFSSIINLPEMSKKDLGRAIYWEAKKVIPIPIEEVVLDWKVLAGKEEKMKKIVLSKKGFYKTDNLPSREVEAVVPREESGKKNLRILLTAAPKELVEKYIKIFNLANLKLLSLETESFALSRSLVGSDPAVIMVIDLGAKTSDIIVIEKGIPLLSRSIDIGGENITSLIMSSLNIDRQKAEQFKIDLGSTYQERIPTSMKDILESIINEIRYSLDLYTAQSKAKIEKIILSGGSAFLSNLPQYLSQTLNMNVYVGDPWSMVVYPTELKPVLEELGPRFAVAAGLAMREII